MPIKPFASPTSPVQQIHLAAERQNRAFDGWLDREIDKQTTPTPGPSMLRAFELATELNSLSIQGAHSLGYQSLRFSTPSDADDGWDVRRYATDEWLNDHPWMLPHFLNGDVLDFPNEERFLMFVARKQDDFERRQELGRAGLLKQFVATAPIAIAEGALGLRLAHAAGAGARLAQVGEWARRGTTAAKAAKWGAIGSSTNVAWELALHGIYPDRNVELEESLLWAGGLGFVFAGTVPVLIGGTNKLGQTVSSTRIQRIQNAVSETLNDTRAGDALQIVQDDVQLLRELITEGQLTAGHRGHLDAGRRVDVDAVGSDRVRHVTVVENAETKPLIDEARQVWGDDVVFHESLMQGEVNWLTTLQELDKTAGDALPADLGPVGTRLASILARGIPLRSLESPGRSLMTSPSALARSAGRLLFDFTWPTEATLRDPINTVNRPPAEGLLWGYHALRDNTVLAVDDIFREGLEKGPMQYTMASGERVNIASRWWDKRRFHRAIVDYLRQSEEASRGHREAPEAPAPIVKAAAHIRRYAREMGKEAQDLGFLDHFDPGRIYLPRRWRADIIRLRRAEFRSKLIAQFRQNRDIDYHTGERLDPSAREVAPEVFGKQGAPAERFGERRGLLDTDRDTIADLYARQAEATPDRPLTEAQLRRHVGEEVYGRYLEEVDIYFERAADSTIDRLTAMEASHGVDQRSATSVWARRVLDIDETKFTDFLDGELETLVGYYHRATAGTFAARRAIRNAAEDWEPMVKELTGKSLRANNYDPGLIIEAVKRQFQMLLDAFAHDPKKQAAIEAAMDATVGDRAGILIHKLADLEGRPVFPGNPAGEAGWRLFLQRNTLRLPYMAMLGKMAISSMTDLANGVFMKFLSPRHVGTTLEALNLFRRVPQRRHLEGLYVATSDLAYSTRSMELGDIAGLADARAFGPGRTGRAMAAVDSGLDYLARKFATVSSQNRWNTNMKRAMATIVTDTIIHDAKKLALAADLMDGGLSQADALRKAGLRQDDAVRLNRLGINADRARRLVAKIDEHGVDWQGNRVTSDHKGFISPEYHAWRHTDRDLFDAVTYSINTEVMNIIIEPKMMSRPLANHYWLGRAFNQFQSFFYAWGNQLAPLAAQRPRYEVAQFAMLSVGLGSLVDAVHNHLSGRRKLADTAHLWTEQPAGMVYAGVARSAVLGWLSRPIAALEHTPLGPARNLGNLEMSQQAARPVDVIGQAGPFFSWATDVGATAQSAMFAGEQWTDASHRRAWRTLPYRNIWWLEAALRTAEDMGYDGFPVNLGPEPTNSGADRP